MLKGKRWEAREARTQEQGETEGCEREYALRVRKEGRFNGGGRIKGKSILALKGKRGGKKE